MAKYTTEVRTICENLAGFDNHGSFGDIDRAIAGSWEEIFQSTWNTHDPDYKVILCAKILKHYWMREIGCETVGLWLHYLNTRLGEIMPYYNKLYESAAMVFDPLNDYDITHTSNRTTDGNTNSTNNGEAKDVVSGTTEGENTSRNTGTTSSTAENTGQSINKFSDTPQGELSGLLNGTYLTSATVDDSTGNQSSQRQSTDEGSGTSKIERTENRTTTNTNTGNIKATTTEDYVLSIKGKSGGKSYAKLLMEYRQSLINIDLEIINNLADLFMGLWA